ncbi:hypothetical protein SAMN05444398_101682 [Roseovarius pacificus]|uniref:Excalibur calcium-binding domain-containing protein n=1 Tax=Roseovarius pacificus TaxID=337701 RepID=A0A1M6Y406_9RHOB|nr:hypothetical protein [Roseovarius pacificus]GGO51397.1 hypothetical protein GCM10011315_04450 [Roseovarius pacificus]SHL12843.1 hypothetical protein SAMN05444398_101682 [Roseovarius pacificus]
MRIILGATALAALTACAPAVPDSGAGVGFGDYTQYQAERQARETQLAGTSIPAPNAVSSETLDGAAIPAGGQGDDAADLAAETQAALREQAANSGQAVVHADPGNPPPQTVTTADGMSEETDFEAVSSERSIESDAALIERNRARYKVIAPEALPARNGTSEPNVVQYALQSNHPRGTQVFSRPGLNKEAKFRRNCAAYASADQAQIDFLSKGGPQRDRLGLDPDGDGYACDWDPRPFRKAVGG